MLEMKGFLRQMLQNYLNKRRLSKKRLVTKDGHCNIEYGNVRNIFAYIRDFWTTFVEIRWRFVCFFFVASFTLSWFIFGLIWYWICRNNGDLAWQNPPKGHIPCVLNLKGMTTAFLFSLETQMTVGYGGRDITPHCPGAIALLIIQTLVGSIINCFWCGVVMTKITLPKKRVKTIRFSDRAVICQNNGALCLQIRVANLRKSLMIGSQIYGKLLRTKINPEGETIILDQVNVDFMVEAGQDSLFFVCPLTLCHMINKASPFFEMAVDTLYQQEFELVVFLDGTDESTSSSCQVRTSYIPQEIIWGYRFLPVISRSKEGKYHVDFSNFAKVELVPTASCVKCFENEKCPEHPSGKGVENVGFEVINISDPASVNQV
ncbi:ATP-sensitive inward rectifier potassium channel 1 [Astyanax mexicanus]|uniref:ATP-sensitive inward rectifier potassium channel 1-like n=1 Tax=Astyanax mexicanus TaxID=7994 RepID=A0A8T2LMC7_ASTMX|nr:ATP-sensitive inward rectifier potassium channel 1 [Astyanax mexicanus]KAG9273308.1 ATP-sensitive inward rectifier potassium channel 1-like [Astyanax mexicanus]